MTYWGQRQREFRAAGRCVTCGIPHDTGKARCRGCQDKTNARMRAHRQQLAKDGRCRQCQDWMPPSRYTRCVRCRVKLAAARKALRDRRAA